MMDRKYRPDIDGLRAIAVISVLLFHCGLSTFSGGFVGVDVFFVISGYLITGHLASDLAASRLSLARFYAARMRRILPALLATLIATWLVALLVFLPSYLVQTSKGLIAAALSVSNIYFWKSASYFSAGSRLQPLLHTWSLSVEEQFYAIIPLLMLMAARLRYRNWAVLFGAASVASFAVSVFVTERAPSAGFYLLPSRAWELGIGAVLATAPLPAIKQRWAAELAGAAGMLLLLVPIFDYDDSVPFPGLNALYPCLGAALIIYVGQSRPCATTRLLSSTPLVWVGLISYSLYLVHWPIIVFTRYSTLEPLDTVQIVAVVAGSLALATLSWRFVERPFRRPSKPATARLLWRGAVGVTAICLIGLLGVGAKGFPARYPAFRDIAAPDDDWKPGRCFFLWGLNYAKWTATDCTRIATGPHRVLLWGDSFAAQYVPGIIANARTINATVLEYTAAGCVPVLSFKSYARGRCRDFNEHALDIIRDQDIQTVVISARWTDIPAPLLGELTSTLVALHAMGVHVIIIGQSPEFAEDVHAISFFKGSKDPDSINRWSVSFNPVVNEKLATLVQPDIFINPLKALCQQDVCPYEENGVFLYSDSGHMTAEGSTRAVREMLVTGHPLGS